MSVDIQSTKDRQNIKVVKDYELINTSYSLSTRASILISYLIARIDSVHQKELTPFDMTFSEIKDIVNFNGVRRISKREDVPLIMKELNSKPIFFYEIDEGEIVSDNWIAWIQHLRYDRKKDLYSFNITQTLHKFLLGLGRVLEGEDEHVRPFIMYKWILVTSFKCDYSIRFYEQIIKNLQGRAYGSFELELEDIRFLCQLQNKYERYYDLKKNVVEAVVSDINGSPYSLYSISWEVGRKKGKSVKSIVFKVTKNKKAKTLVEAPVESLYLKIDELTGKMENKTYQEIHRWPYR